MQVNTAAQPKTRDGKFRRLRQAEKIQRLHGKGKSIPEIVKVTGARYQTVWRTLNRKNRRTPVLVSMEPEREIAEDAKQCDNEYCTSAHSPICECSCEGAQHGVDLIRA